MMLSDEQLQALLDIIDRHHAAFVANFVAPSVLPADVLKRLEDLGMVRPQVQGVRDAYLLGTLAARLPAGTAPRRRLTYDQLADQLRRQPVPLSPVERQAISAAQMTAGQYISGLGARVKVQATQRLMQADAATRAKDRRAYRKTIAHALEQRKQITSVVSDLGHATGDWARNLERVANTELAAALQQGTAQVIGATHGNGAQVAKLYSPLCCDQCRRLYSVDGTPTPRLFSLGELEANGTNVGRKARDWRPVVGPTHPNCLVKGELVTTARGHLPVEQVNVGDFVFTHKGRWRQVLRTHVASYQGELRRLRVEGDAQPLTCTADHPLAVGVGLFAAARQVRVGTPLVAMLTATPLAPAAQPPAATARAERWVGPKGEPLWVVRTPWGAFAEQVCVAGQAAETLPALDGTWRLCSMGLARMVQVAAQSQALGGAPPARPSPPSFPAFMPQVAAPPAPYSRVGPCTRRQNGTMLLARQVVGVRQQGDMITFAPAGARPPALRAQPHYLPRRVTEVARMAYRGPVYNLSVDEDETYVARALVNHNCACTLVHVPPGMAFDAAGHMVAAPA